jgi:putative ABC transport system permease protein
MGKFLFTTPLFKENLDVAVKSVKSNRLRSILTILIIGIGITSLVGVLTATDSLKKKVYSNFEKFGTNSFTIRSKYYSSSGVHRRIKNLQYITFYQAETFKKNFTDNNCIISVFTYAANGITAKYGAKSSNPNLRLVAGDKDYLSYNNSIVEKGRGITETDITNSSFSCVIGAGVAKSLFTNTPAIGKIITISGLRYKIVGLLKSVGVGFGGGADNIIIIPISNARSYFMSDNTSFSIGVRPNSYQIDNNELYGKAESLFRSIRRLSPADESDFTINTSETFMEEINKIMKIITIVSFAIGLITLLGASVGLMNIMLVSVKERTREIGTRKALGASAKLIKMQFLSEAIVISQLGCILGIILGVLIGNATALFMKTSFIIPWLWLCVAILLCLIVGITSGYLPAVKAAKLDPIEALRYE